MNKKQSALIFIFICFVAVAAGIGYTYKTKQDSSIQPQNISPVYSSGNANISVSTPAKGATLSFPFAITGTARVFENIVSARIIDPVTQAVLFEGSEYATAPDAGQFGTYTFSIKELAQMPQTGAIEIQVFWYSPKDGAMLDPVIIPATLQ